MDVMWVFSIFADFQVIFEWNRPLVYVRCTWKLDDRGVPIGIQPSGVIGQKKETKVCDGSQQMDMRGIIVDIALWIFLDKM